MHPLHEYIAKQLAVPLHRRRVVVWYDPREEFRPFVAALRSSAPNVLFEPIAVRVQDVPVSLVEYKGSFFAVRAAVEPLVSVDLPEPLIIYVPGEEPDRKGSLLMELEKAGDRYQPQLRQLARNLLRQRYTEGIIDDMLASEHLDYEDLARLCEQDSGSEPASLLKTLFSEARDNEGLVAAWLADDSHDGEILKKQASRELAKLVELKLGLELDAELALPKLRTKLLHFVLGGEFRADLRCEPPATLKNLPTPQGDKQLGFLRDVARRLRSAHASVYAQVADKVEAELQLTQAAMDADALGTIDTFRFEERALARRCGELIVGGKYDTALGIVNEREHSFWLDRDVNRKAQWQALRCMAELGQKVDQTRSAIDKLNGNVATWIDAYTRKGGLHELDHAQRRLETLIATLDDEPEPEQAVAKVHRGYEEASAKMAEAFTAALRKAEWSFSGLPAGVLHQTRVFADCVAGKPRPLAYFLVDAMRFEMGVSLANRLPTAVELALRPAVTALPSITPVGMAALLPGAAASFDVVEEGGRLGVRIDGVFLPDLSARRKFLKARVPELCDFTLDELIEMSSSKLKKKMAGAQIILVRSQEIDDAGEGGFAAQARRVMDVVIDNLARSIRKLAAAGIEHFVVSADHGHHFSLEKDESMRTAAPGGKEVELHRRCWIGRGGSTPAGCVRVTGHQLGYDTDLDFVFPSGTGVFRAGGDLTFHHGGPSLQELIVPVMTIRMKPPAGEPRTAAAPVKLSEWPAVVTNRIFSVTVQLDEANMSLFPSGPRVQPLLMAATRQVGRAGMAVNAELDRTTGCVTLQRGKAATIALLLSDDQCERLRVVLLDPATDAPIAQSEEIPVRLGT